MIELRCRGPHPDGHPYELGPCEPIVSEHEAYQHRVEVFGPRREEEGLIGDAEQGKENDGRKEQLDGKLRRDQGAEQEHHVREVEQDIERGALRTAEDWQPRKQGNLDRARSAEIEGAAEWWIVSPGERTAATAEAETFEGHAPQDCLLKRDGLVVPRAEAAEIAEARGERTEERPHPDVEDDLEDVHDIDGPRSSVAL